MIYIFIVVFIIIQLEFDWTILSLLFIVISNSNQLFILDFYLVFI
jgi:hypothetical protein